MVIIADLLGPYQFRLGQEPLRKCTGVEDGSILPRRAARAHQENHILAALHLRLDPREVFFAVHWLFIDLQDDVAAGQVDILREGSRLHILHDDALSRRNVESVRHLRGDFAYRDTELARFGGIFVFVVLVFSQARSEQFRSIGDRHRRVLRLSVAQESERDFRAGLARGDLGNQLASLRDLLAVDTGYGVADLQPRLIRRTAGHDARDGHARAGSVDASDRGILDGVEHDSNRTTRDLMLRTHQLVVNFDHSPRRKRKTDASVGVRLAQNRGVDADDFAIQVDQRSAGVAGVDRCIGLNESLELPAGNDVTALSRNDASRDGTSLAERAANGQYPIADLHAVRVTHLRGGQRTVHLDLDHRKIRFLVRADDFCLVLDSWRILFKAHANAVGFLHHVPVGQDVALGIDNHARSQRAFADRSLAGPTLA